MTIYYMCPDSSSPSGGTKQIYRHVGILHRNGISAAILHCQLGFKPEWFEHQVPTQYMGISWDLRLKHTFLKAIQRPRPLPMFHLHAGKKLFYRSKDLSWQKTRLQLNDIIVLPEFYGEKLCGCVRGLRKVIFNQSSNIAFSGYSFTNNHPKAVYLEDQVVGTMVVSEYSHRCLKYAFPSLNISRIHNGIDFSLFKYFPNKKKQIAIMPRKLPDDLRTIIQSLRFRGKLKDWNIIPIDQRTEKEVAEIFKESLIFLSTMHIEGFALPPAEAAASGCVVVGYHGMGGQEYFLPDLCYPVPQGDVLCFSKTLEKVIDLYETDPGYLTNQAKRLSEFIQSKYSLEREEKDILLFWNTILSQSPLLPNLTSEITAERTFITSS